MNKEKIKELWKKYIDALFEYSIKQPPDLFSTPNCATCTHWHLLDEEAMLTISVFDPKEYELISRGMEGKINKAYNENGEYVETYNVHMFYGFCKRFPPTWPESHSITKIGFFSRTNVMTPKILGGYRFPILPHEEHCGEWQQDKWVKELLSEKQEA